MRRKNFFKKAPSLNFQYMPKTVKVKADPRLTKTGKSKCAGGKRPDLGNVYFRSGWEANYARYLNWLQAQGKIFKWQFEPQNFEFRNKKGDLYRRNSFYLPDFKVWERPMSEPCFHEVKGWMDKDSKVKLKRMKEQYPQIRVILIDKKQYESVKQLKALIPNWE